MKKPRVYKIYTFSNFHDVWWPLPEAYGIKTVGYTRELCASYIGNHINQILMKFIYKHNRSKYFKIGRVYEISNVYNVHDLWWTLALTFWLDQNYWKHPGNVCYIHCNQYPTKNNEIHLEGFNGKTCNVRFYHSEIITF